MRTTGLVDLVETGNITAYVKKPSLLTTWLVTRKHEIMLYHRKENTRLHVRKSENLFILLARP